MKVSLQQVQENVASIANRDNYTSDIIYELLGAYGRSKSAITQLREGHLNKAEDANAVLQKDVVYFRSFTAGTSLEDEVENLYEDPLTQRYKPRYLIATDLTNIAAKDNLKDTTLTIKLADIDDHLDFFYAWTGDEVVDTKTEARADRRAADKMNELYVEIEKTNRQEFINNPNFRHELNVFFTRLLFCYFAEDTGIYEDKQFTNAIKTYTQTDGSDLAWFFGELFEALDTKPEDNNALKTPFKEFPFVNGSIFNTTKHAIAIPEFSAQARHLILECGRQDWGEINPDIFGVIFQGVVDPSHRDENGMDYTSVPNIMKVIQPLFLDSLDEEYDKYFDNEKKLWALLARVQKIKIFDPACGSGNFLIIAYKELRKLQHKIIARIDQLRPAGIMGGLPDNQLINIHNFYGIEIDDFAHELAVLSLFLAKHQMNQEFTRQFSKQLSIIPLIDIPSIVHGNAAQLDWQEVCSNKPHQLNPTEQLQMGLEIDDQEPDEQREILSKYIYDEIYLIGNPPYKGAKKQSKDQKRDFPLVFGDTKYNKNLDYISLWFIKGARYISQSRAKLSFVSVNSISQGEHIANLWPYIYENDVEIFFAYTSFKWTNSATNVAAVTCVIIGLQGESTGKTQKRIFTDGIAKVAGNINAYLADGPDIIVKSASKPLSSVLPEMVYGNMPLDGNYLKLDSDDVAAILDLNHSSEKYIRPLIGGRGLVDNLRRWCLWINDDDRSDAETNPMIKERIESSKDFRADGGDVAKTLVSRPHQFRYRKTAKESMILTPRTTTGNRKYIPSDIFDATYITDDSVQVIYDSELWVFAIISSNMHMLWVKSVCGRLQDNYRYSALLGYNTFPIHNLTESEKDMLNKSSRRILLARAAHPGKTLAELYDPKKMPRDLLEAHEENDHSVDQLYKKGGFTNDEDRLATLFSLYEQMTAKEKTK